METNIGNMETILQHPNLLAIEREQLGKEPLFDENGNPRLTALEKAILRQWQGNCQQYPETLVSRWISNMHVDGYDSSDSAEGAAIVLAMHRLTQFNLLREQVGGSATYHQADFFITDTGLAWREG